MHLVTDKYQFNFPEGTTNDEVVKFFEKSFQREEKSSKNMTKLEPGVYQDDDENLFQVTDDGEIRDYKE